MKVVPFNKPKSIWEVLNECTTSGILDKQKAEELLNPLEKGQIRISAALLDILNSDGPEQNQCQAGALRNLLKLITEEHLMDSRRVQKKLKQMELKALGLIGELGEKVAEECDIEIIYEVFKKILFETSDKEIFKVAIEITSLSECCEELIEAYVLIGQSEEFSRYVAYAFSHWIDQKPFEAAAFRVLKLSEDWGTVYLTELLVEQQNLLKDIRKQRNILIGALSNNSIQIEVVTSLATNLDLPQLFELALDDYELFRHLILLYNSLFFDTIPDGGIWEIMEEDTRLIETYMDYLEEVKFDTLKLLGAKDVHEFMENAETEQSMTEFYGTETYEKLRRRALIIWQATYSIPLLKKSLEEGISLYSWCNFIKKHRIVELVEDCKRLYNEESIINWVVEDVLITIGDLETKREIYELLKKFINDEERLREPYSYINVWGDMHGRENSIINKLKVISQLPFEEVVDFNIQLLEDYNPQVRSGAISELFVRSEELIKRHEILVEKLVDRLGDSPFYIRNDALQLCKAKHIKISQARAKAIEVRWQSRNEINNDEFMKVFRSLQERIVSIVPPHKGKEN